MFLRVDGYDMREEELYMWIEIRSYACGRRVEQLAGDCVTTVEVSERFLRIFVIAREGSM